MKKSILLCLAGSILLSGCGGGGGQNDRDDNAFTNAGNPKFELLATRTTLPANPQGIPYQPGSEFSQQVDIRILQQNDVPIPDLTLIFLKSSDDASLNVSACAQSIGGRGSFFANSGIRTGTVTLTASVVFPYLPGTIEQGRCTQTFRPDSVTYTRDFTFQIVAGTVRLLEIRPQRTTLPPNTANVAPFITSPYLSQLEIVKRDSRGVVQDGGFDLSLNPVPSLPGGISRLDDPSTEPNEFTTKVASTSVSTTAGRAVAFFHAPAISGQYTLNVRDRESGQQDSVVFTIAQNTTTSPSQIRIVSDGRPTYIQGSNANTEYPLQAIALDGQGLPIGDSTGPNNVQMEILNPINGSGERLTSASTEGVSVRLRTTVGVAQANYRSGTRSGQITVRATIDRADNNVDNGLQNPVSALDTFTVGDGRLFRLALSAPDIAALRSFPVDPSVTALGVTSTQPRPSPDQAAPADGTYSLTISAKAQDREGLPVVAGTAIQFGIFDEPATGYPAQGSGTFTIAGNDGDPQEGGSLFTSVTGGFTTKAGGVGPGDTLVLFGEEDARNRDLESARLVGRVLSSTSLEIQNRFNFNDDTGSSQNFGPVLPYIIGRSAVGSIQGQAFTNAFGVATTTITYPVSRINKSVVLWARGQGDLVQGTPEFVSDVEQLVYPGIAFDNGQGLVIGTLNASPQFISAARPSTIFVCARDGFGSPIPGVEISFTATNGQVANSSIRVDGQSGAGKLANRTNLGGCASAVVEPAGTTGQGVTLQFAVGSVVQSNAITVSGPSNLLLQAIPNLLGGQGGRVLLRLLDGGGLAVAGVQVRVTCPAAQSTSGGVLVLQQPGVTNAQGETQAELVGFRLDGFGSANAVTCEFAAGDARATVTLVGTDICQLAVSPIPPQCAGAGPTINSSASSTATLSVSIDNTGAAAGVVSSDVGGINCGTAGQSACSVRVTRGNNVRLTATPDSGSLFCGWTGDSDCSSSSNTVNVSVTANKSCSAKFRANSCN